MQNRQHPKGEVLNYDVLLGRVQSGAVPVTEAHQILQVVSPRYPRGFIPPALAVVRRREP